MTYDGQLRDRVGQCELDKTGEAFRPQPIERLEELAERTSGGRGEHRFAIERRKRHGVSMPEDVFHSRHPVRALAVNQVPDDVERAPGVRAFRCAGPRGRKILQQRAECAGRAPENGQRLVEPKHHDVECLRDNKAPAAIAPATRNQHTGGTTTKTNAAWAFGGRMTRTA